MGFAPIILPELEFVFKATEQIVKVDLGGVLVLRVDQLASLAHLQVVQALHQLGHFSLDCIDI